MISPDAAARALGGAFDRRDVRQARRSKVWPVEAGPAAAGRAPGHGGQVGPGAERAARSGHHHRAPLASPAGLDGTAEDVLEG